ncbi:tetratricopeptide repeat protein [Sphingobium sp.]|uniref:tetratricopeptide repeat protein n=1 Tax=Sphingobium sp. TaxID=1912891 RepID=UPI002603A76F|nr:tetratricopeptide repeat protein [Sphingobium sp.]
MRIHHLLSSRLVLAIAVAASVATPAVAKKKPVVAGPPIILSDAFRANVQAAEAALRARDAASASTQIAALSPTTDMEAYLAAGLRFQLAVLRGDVQAERVALTDLFKTTSLPRSDAPRLRYVAGYLSYRVGNYDDATAQLDYAKTLGYDGVDATMLRADIALRRNKPKEARPFVQAAIAAQKAAGKPVPISWIDRAISMAYQAGDWTEVGQLYRERLNQQESREDWRAALVNYQTGADPEPQLQLDLYRLQAANGAMASERDYQAYAQAAEKAGCYAEARTIIEAGRAAGKLTAAQAATSQLLKSVTPKATKEIAALPAQAKKAAAASSGKDALAVADSYFSLSQYPQAAEQYRAAIAKGGVDADRANARLGVALARSGDLANAQSALAQVNGSWAPVAGFWSAWVAEKSRKAG